MESQKGPRENAKRAKCKKRISVLRNINVKISFLIIMHTCFTLLIIDYRYREAVYVNGLQKVHKKLDMIKTII